MIYFSPKLLVASVSGIGVVGCGLLTWQLTKNNKISLKKALEEVTNTCGNYAWVYEVVKLPSERTEKNSKGKTFSEYNECENQILQKYDLNPPSPTKKK